MEEVWAFALTDEKVTDPVEFTIDDTTAEQDKDTTATINTL